MTTISLNISGMSCASCSGRVEKALSSTAGVLKASVNLATEIATVEVAEGTTAAALIARVQSAGYKATERTETAPIEGAAQGPAAPSTPEQTAAFFLRGERS